MGASGNYIRREVGAAIPIAGQPESGAARLHGELILRYAEGETLLPALPDTVLRGVLKSLLAEAKPVASLDGRRVRVVGVVFSRRAGDDLPAQAKDIPGEGLRLLTLGAWKGEGAWPAGTLYFLMKVGVSSRAGSFGPSLRAVLAMLDARGAGTPFEGIMRYWMAP